MRKAFLITVLCTLVSSCSTFSEPQPTTPQERFQLEMQKRQAMLILGSGLLEASQPPPPPPQPQTINLNVHHW